MSRVEHIRKHPSSTTASSSSSSSSSSASTGPKSSLNDNTKTTTATPYETLQTVGNSTNVAWHKTSVTRSDHERRNGHRGVVLWFTGLSGSGKSTLANAVTSTLFHPPHSLSTTTVLDGDNVRHGLCSDLGFSPTDRSENIRRVGHLAKVLMDGVGCIVCTAFVSPYAKDRDLVRGIVTGEGGDGGGGGGGGGDGGCFVEVYCKADLTTCEVRDTKGLYAKARSGVIPEFTGVSSPYEVPENPELVVDTGSKELEDCVEDVVGYLEERGIIPKREVGDGGGPQ